MLFTAAVFATIGRIIIRIRYQRRLFADDYVLLFGCFSLIAAFTLVNVMSGSLSFDMALYLGPTDALPEGSVFRSFETRILLLQKLCYSCEVALWVTIFAVKMSYLLFFRHLIKRMKSHMTYWKVALCIVVVSGIFCIGSIFIICSYFGVAASEYLHIRCSFPLCNVLINYAQDSACKHKASGRQSLSRRSRTP